METYYTLLDIPVQAPTDEIAAAYERQCKRYRPERVAGLGSEFERLAVVRMAELERAYAILADPVRRRAYDRSIGVALPEDADQVASRRRLSRRERMLAIGGAAAGLLLIALVWLLTGGNAQSGRLPIAQMRKPAPAFALPGLRGKTVRLSDYRGKVVLVNFWGTWCEPCKEETPALAAVYRKLQDQGLMIIGVDLRNQERPGPDGDADVRAFTERYGVTYPIALDIAGETARAFQIYPLPTSFVVDQNGMIRYVRVGQITAEEVETLFARLQQDATALFTREAP
jgi:cytochrome c biogenesis protein CcmG, thiol:disulfide interchange protein DsbE